VHHKTLSGVLTHAIGTRAFAIKQLYLAFGGGGVAQWLEDGLAQRRQQRGGGFVNFVAVGLQRCGRFIESLPPTVLQARHPIEHRLRSRHMIQAIRHKVPKALKLKLLVGLRGGQ
jgi:hypothetical protein